MRQCAHCGAEIQTYAAGKIPICTTCSDAQKVTRDQPSNPEIRIMLFQNLISATAHAESAREAFLKITGGAVNSLPHPDGTQRVTKVSRELAVAREKLMEAHHRLNDYLNREVVPENLELDG